MDIKQFHKLLLISFLVCFQYGLSSIIDEDYIDEPSFNRCPWIRNKLKNGRVRYRYKGRVAKFLCDSGFELAGKRSSTCVRGQWSNPVPVCVARGCGRLPSLTNGRITEMYRGAFLVYDCNPGYVLDGNPTNHCNGRTWYTSTPLCVVATENPEPSCDFENPDLCGWTQDPNHDFDWLRNQFSTPSGHVGTGPAFDHTFGENKGGFYLFIEASSPRKINDTSRLFSPVYSKELSGGCFIFWYHMYGATTGRLRVYLKPESHVFDELKPNWEKVGDQGNEWLKGHMIVPVLNENFQIVIEGVRGESYVGDSAIDDVRLTTNLCHSDDNSTDITEAVDQNSCRGRCQESGSESSCGCNTNCVDEPNFCCRDYYTICTAGNSTTMRNSEEPLPEDYTTTSSASTKSTTFITVTNSEVDSNITTESTAEKLELTSGTFSVISSTTLLTSVTQTSNTYTTASSVIPVSYTTQNTSSSQYNTNSQSTTLSSLSMTSTSLKTEAIMTSSNEPKSTQSVSSNTYLVTENSTQSILTTETSKAIISSTAPEKTSIAIQTTSPTTKSTIFTTSTQTTPNTTSTVSSIYPTTLKTTLNTQTVPVTELQNISTKIIKSTSSYRTDFNTTSSIAATTLSTERNKLSTMSVTSTAISTPTATSTTEISTTTLTSTVPATRKIYNLRPRTRVISSKTYTDPTVLSTNQISFTTNATLKAESPVTSFTTKSGYLTSWYRNSISSTKQQLTTSSEITVRPLILVTSVTNHPRWENTVGNTPDTTRFSDRIRNPTKSNLPETSEFYDSGASKADTKSSSSSVSIVVSITVITLICLIAGLAYYIKKHRNKRQSKLSDDSEMRFLQENDYMEYSDASALERILVK